MGQEEGTVSYPRSLSPASASSSSSMPEGAQPNKCYTEWDFCNSGTEAENAYFWRLGWYSAAEEQGEVSVSLGEFMGGEPPAAPIVRRNPIIRTTRAAPRPEASQDPWNRALCLMTHPDNLGELDGKLVYICGWDATLPPGMLCVERREEAPWDCTRHGLSDASLTLTAGG